MKISRRKFVGTAGAVMASGFAWFEAFGEKLSLSGKVSDTSAHTVPSATVSAKRLRDGKMFSARINGDGDYVIPDLEAGDYKVWAKAGDLSVQPVKVTLAAGLTTDLVLSPTAKAKER
jgi:carboxypeptidase family protein